MSLFLDLSLLMRFLPMALLACSVSLADDEVRVPNELNSPVEEPLIYLPEADDESPFRSVSRSRPVTSINEDAALVRLAEEAVDSTRRRLLTVEQNSPWQMMHGLLALRHDFQISKNGQTVSGLHWIATGPTYDGDPWFEKTPHGGRAHPYSRPWAFEGHANQFLAVLSMCELPVDHQFQTPSGPITISDMVKHAQKTVNTKDEPTWTLWSLSRYLPPESHWRNVYGETWSIERLVSTQTAKPLKGTACGGTHGLFAIAHARNVYLRTGRPLSGVWLEAEYKIRKHINIARAQQNSNGMLSSNYFRGRDYKQDFNKRMASAGHILEFLMIALPQDELQERWVQQAIKAAAEDLIRNRKEFVRCSPLYHAVNGLNIYLDRVRPTQTAMLDKIQAGALKSVEEANESQLKKLPVTSISQSGTDNGAETPESDSVLTEPDSPIILPREEAVTSEDDDIVDTPGTPVSSSSESSSGAAESGLGAKIESDGWRAARPSKTQREEQTSKEAADDDANADEPTAVDPKKV